MLLLSREDIKKVFTIKDAIEADKESLSAGGGRENAKPLFGPISRRQSMRDVSCSCPPMWRRWTLRL